MMKALIVEDEVLARLGLHQLIDWNQMGIDLLEDAKTGKEAIRIIDEEKPDIVLLDLNIPEINGLMVQRHIAEHQLPCRTIVISCNEEFSSVKDVMRYGAFDYLRKLNLSAESLKDALERCKEAGFWVAGASEKADQSIWDANLKGKIVLVLGNEHDGISHLVLESCDMAGKLPMMGRIESLNVAQAATACMYEWLRQNW